VLLRVYIYCRLCLTPEQLPARSQAFHEFDLDGDGALTPVEMKELTAAIGLVGRRHWSPLHGGTSDCCVSQPDMRATARPLASPGRQGWSTKDIVSLLDVGKKELKKELKEKKPTLIDFLQFMDAVVEVHGDPFFELRYRCVCTQSSERHSFLPRK
jgi:hypothetical protein